MTHDEILNMPAGQDMDMLIAENVLMLDNNGWNELFFHNRTKFSADISAAWEVVKEVKKHRYDEIYERFIDYFRDELRCENIADFFDYLSPLAICRAALLAVMK